MNTLLQQQGLEVAQPCSDLERALTEAGYKWREIQTGDLLMKRYRVTLNDHAELSVIRGPYSWGGEEGLFETGLLVNGKLENDPEGYQTIADVLATCEQYR